MVAPGVKIKSKGAELLLCRGAGSHCARSSRLQKCGSRCRRCGVILQALAFDPQQNAPWVSVRHSAPDAREQQETVYAWRDDFHEQYEWLERINAGSFGEVWLAKELATGRKVAVKELKDKRGRLPPQRVREKVEQELRVLTVLGGSPLVVRLQGGYRLKGCYEIVMEHCAGQDLKHYTVEHGPFSEQITAAVAHEILKVIRKCHEHNIVHGDIKTSNFMLQSETHNPFVEKDMTVLECGWLKAIDFGCSQILKDSSGRLRSRVGTPVYMAPEVFQRDFGMECDMWSLGVILFQLISGTFPFWRTSHDALMCSVPEVSEIVQTQPVDFASRPVWQTVSADCRNFICRLLVKDYKKRMTLSEAEEHPFLSSNITLDNEGNIMLHSSNIVEYKGSMARNLTEAAVP